MKHKAVLLALLVVLGVAAGYLIWRSLSSGPGQVSSGLVLGQPASAGGGPWTISLQGVNQGGSAMVITGVAAGGVDLSGQVASPGLPLAVGPGAAFSLSFTIPSGGGTRFAPGETATVVVSASDGSSYDTSVTLTAATTSTGANTGGPGGGAEKLVLTASVVSGSLNVTVLNMSPGAVVVKQVFFNGQPAGVTFGTGFSATSDGLLPSASTGSFAVSTSGTVSGAIYNIVVMTAAGNSFQATVTWP